MTTDEYIAKIQSVIEQIERNREAETLTVTMDLLTQVKARIQGGGTDYQGRMFPPYTPSYAKYGRVKMGYQVRYVDFTRDGRMWASIMPVAEQKTRDSVEFSVRARDGENQAKLNGQFAKRGNILLPSAEEIAAAREANNRRIAKYLQQLR